MEIDLRNNKIIKFIKIIFLSILGLVIAIYLLMMLNMHIINKKDNELWLIPKGYIGTIKVIQDSINGNKTIYNEDGWKVFRFDESGIYRTNDTNLIGGGYLYREFYYYDENDVRIEIEDLNPMDYKNYDVNKIYNYALGSIIRWRKDSGRTRYLEVKIGNPNLLNK